MLSWHVGYVGYVTTGNKYFQIKSMGKRMQMQVLIDVRFEWGKCRAFQCITLAGVDSKQGQGKVNRSTFVVCYFFPFFFVAILCRVWELRWDEMRARGGQKQLAIEVKFGGSTRGSNSSGADGSFRPGEQSNRIDCHSL